MHEIRKVHRKWKLSPSCRSSWPYRFASMDFGRSPRVFEAERHKGTAVHRSVVVHIENLMPRLFQGWALTTRGHLNVPPVGINSCLSSLHCEFPVSNSILLYSLYMFLGLIICPAATRSNIKKTKIYTVKYIIYVNNTKRYDRCTVGR